MENTIIISDPTLRDGNHAVKHQLTRQQVARYAAAANAAGVPIVEVGHGNGLGASSIQVGLARESDRVLLEAAREQLSTSKLGIHVIPGFATINKDLREAIAIGVDVVRVASHCTEADTTQRHIGFAREQDREVYGVLMMSHMASADVLAEEAIKMWSYGAEGVVIMDSAGHYLPEDVEERISALCSSVNVQVGFHGHNNLGMGVANSLAAIRAGATILDGTARCFGAGAGNTQLEVLVAVLERMGYSTGIDLYKLLDASDIAEGELMETVPAIRPVSIVSGLAGVFSGFAKHVTRIADEYDLDPRDIFLKLGERKVVAGQEDVIIEVAMQLAQQRPTGTV